MGIQRLSSFGANAMSRLTWRQVAHAMLFTLFLLDSVANAQDLSSSMSLGPSSNDDHRILAGVDPVPFAEIEEKILVIDERTAQLPLSSGPSFVVAIALPEDRNWTELLIYSYRRPELFSRNKAFFPEVVILDEQRRYVRTFPAKDFILAAETADEPHRLSAYIELNPDPNAERYLVIHTTEDALELDRSRTEKPQLSTTFIPTLVRSLPLLPVPVVVTPERKISGSEKGSIKLKVNRPMRLND